MTADERAHILRQIRNAQGQYDSLRSVRTAGQVARGQGFRCIADAREFWRESLMFWQGELAGMADR